MQCQASGRLATGVPVQHWHDSTVDSGERSPTSRSPVGHLTNLPLWSRRPSHRARFTKMPTSQSYKRRCVVCQHSPDDQTLRLQAAAGEDDVIHLPSGLDDVDCYRQEEDKKTTRPLRLYRWKGETRPSMMTESSCSHAQRTRHPRKALAILLCTTLWLFPFYIPRQPCISRFNPIQCTRFNKPLLGPFSVVSLSAKHKIMLSVGGLYWLKLSSVCVSGWKWSNIGPSSFRPSLFCSLCSFTVRIWEINQALKPARHIYRSVLCSVLFVFLDWHSKVESCWRCENWLYVLKWRDGGPWFVWWRSQTYWCVCSVWMADEHTNAVCESLEADCYTPTSSWFQNSRNKVCCCCCYCCWRFVGLFTIPALQFLAFCCLICNSSIAFFFVFCSFVSSSSISHEVINNVVLVRHTDYSGLK